jgi:aspartyl-tRNA(Asn)/glutamyl-tRNA(Gln) amidotransferase subunit B
MSLMSKTATLAEDVKIAPQKIADLINLVAENKINRNTSKDVFEKIFTDDIEPVKYVEENGLLMLNDDSLVEETIEKVIAENPQSIEDIRAGKKKASGFLVGQTMKLLKGKANPQTINEILAKKLEEIL